MATKGFSIGEAIRFAWDLFKNNAGFLVVVVLIVGLISLATSSLQDEARPNAFLSFLAGIISAAVNLIIAMGIINISLKFVDGGRAEYADLISIYPLFFTFLISAFLYSLIVAAGLILFIIPGIILGIRYQFFGYFIIDKKAGVVDSLSRSWDATRGVTLSLFLFNLALLVIIIIGALALGVGLLVALPVAWLALAFVYRRLQTQTEAAVQEKPAA